MKTKENEISASSVAGMVNLIAGITCTVSGCAMYILGMKSYLSILLLGGICFSGWLLNRTGHTKSSAVILIAALVIILQYNIFIAYGIHDVAIVAWPVLIFFAGLFFGSRTMPYMTAFIMTLAVVTKVIPNGNNFTGDADTGDLVMLLLIIAGSSLIVWKIIRGNEHNTIALVHNIHENKRIIAAQILSENRFRSLFDNSPVSLWEEDYSLLFVYLDDLRHSGVENFRAFFENHPEEVLNCLGRVKIIDVNEETLIIYHAKTKEDFLVSLDKIFCVDSLSAFKEELIWIAEGKNKFECETVNQNLLGEIMDVALVLTLAPSTDEIQYRAFVAIRDITDSKRTKQEMEQNQRKLTMIANELELHNVEMANLTEMGDLFLACQTIEEAYAIISEYAARLFPGESGTLSIFNPSRDLLNVATGWGQTETTAQSFNPKSCWALRRGKVHFFEGEAGVNCTHFLLQTAAPASICVPIIAQSDILGVISLVQEPSSDQTLEGASHFSETKLHLVSAFAEHIGIAIANLNLRETLRYQAIRDPLTNLYNRRFMVESLERELDRSQRKGSIVGIIMLDIDHFKKFNDSFGHEAGDIVLTTLGNYFLSHMRAGDIACRFGGEEFIMIFPETSLSIIYKRAEELREGVKQLTLGNKGKSLGNITVSLGISLFPEHGETVDMLLQAADKALYLAKAEGRDQVRVADMSVDALSAFEVQVRLTPDPAEL